MIPKIIIIIVKGKIKDNNNLICFVNKIIDFQINFVHRMLRSMQIRIIDGGGLFEFII